MSRPPDQPDLFSELPPPPSSSPNADPPADDDSVPVGAFAERAYLEYAISVVKGRALPDLCDGQKPVQRRILFAMHEMGLASSAKPVKAARVVGDVLGKFHPHGDQAAYDALVRMAQDFTLRYPVIDGHGNFGSRDGDSPAAMRYTEARLTPIAQLLLAELEQGTVDFAPNYDGAFTEPRLLPAQLPFVLLNGASGIAVGMATEIPPHNLREVAAAAVLLIKEPQASLDQILQLLPGPDFPGGGQIISSATELRSAYDTGRGSVSVRARWRVEDLARGQWQVVVDELPPNTSTQKVMQEIEELTNPKPRPGKKSLSQEQQQTRQMILSVLDTQRDESGKENAVRLVLEPRSSRQSAAEFMQVLLAHTSLEASVPINMVMIGIDGRPRQKSLRDILGEWISFRTETLRRRISHRLGRVRDRIHILEGRRLVLLNVDRVIAVIRGADEPKAELMVAFALTERQADDILEMRLRQLAKLEAIKIEQELAELGAEETELANLLGDAKALRRRLVREIEADAKQFGDARRTPIEASERVALAASVVDEPITVLFSRKAWVRSRSGHGHDPSTFGFKEGDTLAAAIECRSVDQAVFLASNGRVFTLPVAQLPGGRGDGVPVASLIELEAGARILHIIAGAGTQEYLFSGSGGYGFRAMLGDLTSRMRAGKQFLNLEAGEEPLTPAPIRPTAATVVTLSAKGRVLAFPLAEVKALAAGGRGVILMGLDRGERLLSCVAADAGGALVHGEWRGKAVQHLLRGAALAELVGARARKGKLLPVRIKPEFLELPPPAPTDKGQS